MTTLCFSYLISVKIVLLFLPAVSLISRFWRIFELTKLHVVLGGLESGFLEGVLVALVGVNRLRDFSIEDSEEVMPLEGSLRGLN